MADLDRPIMCVTGHLVVWKPSNIMLKIFHILATMSSEVSHFDLPVKLPPIWASVGLCEFITLLNHFSFLAG